LYHTQEQEYAAAMEYGLRLFSHRTKLLG